MNAGKTGVDGTTGGHGPSPFRLSPAILHSPSVLVARLAFFMAAVHGFEKPGWEPNVI